jgi:hypothetical protein
LTLLIPKKIYPFIIFQPTLSFFSPSLSLTLSYISFHSSPLAWKASKNRVRLGMDKEGKRRTPRLKLNTRMWYTPST